MSQFSQLYACHFNHQEQLLYYIIGMEKFLWLYPRHEATLLIIKQVVINLDDSIPYFKNNISYLITKSMLQVVKYDKGQV